MLKRFGKRYLSSQSNNFVKIVEVSPRDGLQNEKSIVSTTQKLQLINQLVESGLKVIEAGSFVSPKWVPQMADTPEIYSKLKGGSVSYPALVPNLKGLEGAMKVGVKEIAIFGAASELFSQKNINCSVEESLDRFSKVTALALENGIKVRGYVSTVVGCPYQGEVPVDKVVEVAKAMYDIGCYEISLGDTIGVGTPNKVSKMLDAVMEVIPKEKLAIHFHDTYGQAIGNIVVGLQKGIRIIDSSVAGLGGCPYAKGASGNVATEDVVYLLHGMGLKTGIDIQKLVKTGAWISKELNRPNMSKAGVALGHKL